MLTDGFAMRYYIYIVYSVTCWSDSLQLVYHMERTGVYQKAYVSL